MTIYSTYKVTRFTLSASGYPAHVELMLIELRAPPLCQRQKIAAANRFGQAGLPPLLRLMFTPIRVEYQQAGYLII